MPRAWLWLRCGNGWESELTMPKCPVGCGECCDDWSYIGELWTKERRKTLNRDDPCPNLGPEGCVLPRNRRPKICREHLCARAKHALEVLRQEKEKSKAASKEPSAPRESDSRKVEEKA